MTDKVQKIKQWISREQDGLMDDQGNFEYPEHQGAYDVLCNLDAYIDSLQEEPANDDEKVKKFKVGDVVVYVSRQPAYSGLYLLGNPNDLSIGYSNANEPYQIALRNCTVASEDECKQFMRELESNGYKWNEDTLRIEKEERVSKDFEMALAEMVDKAQRCVVEPWVVAAQWKDYLVELAKSEEPVSEQNLSNVQRTVKEWKEPVSEELKEAADSYIKTHGEILGFSKQTFKAGAKWQKEHLWKPVDKVYSRFVEEYNKSEHRYGSPKELFYLYIDREKGESRHSYGLSKFFVSSDGTLCKYPNRTTYKSKWRRRQPPKSHTEFNKNVLKDLKIDQNNYGPIYLGKLWATAKGMTKVMNVWLVRTEKLTGRNEWGGVHNVRRAERTNLEEFTIANVAGYGTYYRKKTPLCATCEEIIYNFIVKLSDLKI